MIVTMDVLKTAMNAQCISWFQVEFKTNMGDGLARILSKQDFKPTNFVNKLSLGGEDDLGDMREKVQRLADETAVALKKNVYKNYSQFIETAREISILEGEMYQLSHMLTDQKSIMNTLIELSLTGDNVEDVDEAEEDIAEEDTTKNLVFLLEKVEGCSSVTEVPDRYLVHNGDLIEVDPETFVQTQKVHAFLLNDMLMIATWLPYRRGLVKYRFRTLYELDSLAVVNVRDVGNCKNAFKILMFPDTKMFQAESPKAKRQWLDILEESKKKKSALDKQRKEAAAASLQERISTASFDDNNPFAEVVEPERPGSVSGADSELLHVEWVQETPEDLDVCIAQRDFEGAVDLVEKVNDYLASCPKVLAVREYRARIEHRIKQLTKVLMHELQSSPERSIRGGPRAARRAVAQLIRLGKSPQACDLFLKNRSAMIKYNIRQLKIEGATTLYIKRVCEVFFGNLQDTASEFMKAFPQHFPCFSAFVVWAREELQSFVKTFGTQVFQSKTGFATISECVFEARRYCSQLSDIGLELLFALDHLMEKDVQKAIQLTGDHQMEAVKHRASDDLWRPVNYKTAAAVKAFETEMTDLGVANIDHYTFDSVFTALTTNTIQFTKSYVSFCEDMMRVYCDTHHYLITAAFADVLGAQLKHAEKAIHSRDFSKDQKYIVQNAQFLGESVLPLVDKMYLKTTGQKCISLLSLQSMLRRIQSASKVTLGEFV